MRILSPPPRDQPRPALLWIHGGGFLFGSAKQDEAMCVRFAQRLDMVVVSVDYRLAPEHPYPAPVEDCFAAFELMHREAGALGIDPQRIVVGGASAGGGLAATLVLLIHDRQRPAPLMQLLVYPMLDDRTTTPEAARDFHRMWDVKSNVFGWQSYLGKSPGGAEVPAHAAAGRREDLTGLPPAWIGVGTCDLFHDEDLAYAEQLKAAGVPTTVKVVEGAFHGFDVVLAQKPVSLDFFDAQVNAIAKRLAETAR